MKEASSSHYGAGAYHASAIPVMPAPPKKRERIGEELLPFGDYAGLDPYHQLCEDAEFVQHQELLDKKFFETDDWWWNHRHIKFMSKSTGISVGIMLVPYSCAFLMFGAVFYLSVRMAMYLETVSFF